MAINRTFSTALRLGLSFLPLTALCSVCAPAAAQSVTVPIIEKIGESKPTADLNDLSKESHQGKAIGLLRQGNPKEAETEALTALEEAKKGSDENIIASCYAVLGKVLRRQNRYQESLDAYQKALDHWKAKTDDSFNGLSRP